MTESQIKSKETHVRSLVECVSNDKMSVYTALVIAFETGYAFNYSEYGGNGCDLEGGVLTVEENELVNLYSDCIAKGKHTLPEAIALVILLLKQQYLKKIKQKVSEVVKE